MSRTEDAIRIVTASCAAFIAVVFVLGYNWAKYHNAVEHHRMALPVLTDWVAGGAAYALIAPPMFLGFGLLFLFHGNHTLVVLTISLAWLFSLGWPLLCIAAWEMPFVLL